MGGYFYPIIVFCSNFTLGKTKGRWSSFFSYLTLYGLYRNKVNQRISVPSLFKWIFSLFPHRKTHSLLVKDPQLILSIFLPLARILGSSRMHVLKHSEAISIMSENSCSRFCRKTRQWLFYFLCSLRMTWVGRYWG